MTISNKFKEWNWNITNSVNNSIDKFFTIYIFFELEILYVYYILLIFTSILRASECKRKLTYTKIQKNQTLTNAIIIKTQSKSKYLTFSMLHSSNPIFPFLLILIVLFSPRWSSQSFFWFRLISISIHFSQSVFWFWEFQDEYAETLIKKQLETSFCIKVWIW
jgi:NADH:ubiquinone oxidoreductase subunit 4 (subunit M)